MLSGGEQQRVAVARALVMQPALLLADEPTGDLDEQTADSLHALLREMHQAYGLTSVIATHNPRLAAACDRVLRLEAGGFASERRADAPARRRRIAGDRANCDALEVATARYRARCSASKHVGREP